MGQHFVTWIARSITRCAIDGAMTLIMAISFLAAYKKKNYTKRYSTPYTDTHILYTHTRVHTRTHTCAHTHTHRHTDTDRHTYTHTHTHTHTNTQTDYTAENYRRKKIKAKKI